MTTSAWDPWNFHDRPEMAAEGMSLVGYSVQATDGDIGKVDDATMDVDASHIVVDTGPWIFGRRVMLPAGTINSIDRNDEKVYVDRTKDQIKDSPAFEGADPADPAYREQLGTYYGGTYGGL
jgi:hypothetical protein